MWYHRVCFLKPRRPIYFFFLEKITLHVEGRSRSDQRWSGHSIKHNTREVMLHMTWQLIMSTLVSFPPLWHNFLGVTYWCKTEISPNVPCDVPRNVIKIVYAKLKHWVMQSACNNKIAHTWHRLHHFHSKMSSFSIFPLTRAGKSGWGGPDRTAGAGRWLPVSTYYPTSIVRD